MNVKIIPKVQRAKNRVNEHGEVMKLHNESKFQGQPAILVESLGDTWRGEKWKGWFTADEIEFEKLL